MPYPTITTWERNRLYLGYLLLFLCLSFLSHEASGKSLLKNKWVEVSTENFVIYSSLNEQKTVELGKALENFRSTIALITNKNLPDKEIKTHIYVFRKAMPEIGLDWKYGGIFRQLLRGNYVIMRSFGNRRNVETLQHEYTHYIMRQTNTREYPAWHDEGFAQLLSTVEVKGDVVEYGSIPDSSAESLKRGIWRPFDWIINVTDIHELNRWERTMFYAQAWALFHYLNLGRKDHNFAAQTDQYLNLLNTGKSNEEAFELAYSVSLETIDRKLKRYLSRDINFFSLHP